MGNCLAIKLKSEVNSDLSLPKLGVITLNVKNEQLAFNRLGGYDSSHPVSVFLKDGDLYNWQFTTQFPNPYNASGATSVGCRPTTDTILEIGDKYNLGYFGLLKYEISQDGRSLTNQGFFDGVINIDDYEYCDHLRVFNMLQCDVVGNIENFAKCTELATLTLGCGKIDGDLVALVRKQIANGRDTTGSMEVRVTRWKSDLYVEDDVQVKFNGVRIAPIYENGALSWESSNKISYVISDTVWCTGYSSSEIETKTASGGDWAGKNIINTDE